MFSKTCVSKTLFSLVICQPLLGMVGLVHGKNIPIYLNKIQGDYFSSTHHIYITTTIADYWVVISHTIMSLHSSVTSERPFDFKLSLFSTRCSLKFYMGTQGRALGLVMYHSNLKMDFGHDAMNPLLWYSYFSLVLFPE